MTEVDGALTAPLETRPRRTDWFWSRGRVLLIALVAMPLIARVLEWLGTGRGDRVPLEPFETAVWTGVVLASIVVVWGWFTIGRRTRALRARGTASVADPWRRHGHWPSGGEKRVAGFRPSKFRETLRRYLKATAGISGVAWLLLTPAAGSHALIVASGVSFGVAMLLRMRGYSEVEVQWREQPARTGGQAHYVVRLAPFPAGGFDRVELTLRCVLETSRRGGLSRPEVTCPFAATRRFGDELFDGPVALHARFDVPAEFPGSDPDAEPAVFWELVVSGERSGSQLDETFLVPVYASLS